jgi:hypothetical protein
VKNDKGLTQWQQKFWPKLINNELPFFRISRLISFLSPDPRLSPCHFLVHGLVHGFSED